MLQYLAQLILARPLGRVVVGAIVIVVGIIIGLSSHQVRFQEYEPTSENDLDLYYLTNKSEYYIHALGTDTYYVITTKDFSPTISDAAFDTAVGLAYLVHSSDRDSIKAREEGTSNKIAGDGYRVVKLVLLDEDGKEVVYTTSQYNKNPDGYYQNNWIIGVIVSFVGLLLAGLTLILGRKKTQASTMAAPGYPGPYGQPYPPGSPIPYGQPPQPGIPGAYGQFGQQPPPGSYPVGQQGQSPQPPQYSPYGQPGQPVTPSQEPTTRQNPF